ncbi:Uncharacterised protein [uncultured archaeon]|nr:Uncharacterised protein [uncultured archaeon]
MTASMSFIVMLALPRYGNALFSSDVTASRPLTEGSGLTPQSIIIFEWFVSIRRLLLPTSLNPPSAVAFIHSLFIIGWFIFLPICVRNFFLKSASLNRSCRTPFMTSLFIVGILRTLGTQPVSRTIFIRVDPPLPMTRPGFMASICTSLKSGTNLIESSDTPASLGTISSILAFVSSGSFRLDASLLTISFFFMLVETLLMTCSLPYIAATFLA